MASSHWICSTHMVFSSTPRVASFSPHCRASQALGIIMCMEKISSDELEGGCHWRGKFLEERIERSGCYLALQIGFLCIGINCAL